MPHKNNSAEAKGLNRAYSKRQQLTKKGKGGRILGTQKGRSKPKMVGNILNGMTYDTLKRLVQDKKQWKNRRDK